MNAQQPDLGNESRISRLEGDILVLKWAFGCCLGVTVILAFGLIAQVTRVSTAIPLVDHSPHLQTVTAAQVTVKRLSIVNERREETASIVYDEKLGTTLALSDRGKTRLTLNVDLAGSPSVGLWDVAGRNRANLRLNEDGEPSIAMFDKRSLLQFSSAVANDGPAAVRIGADKKAGLIDLAAGRTGPRLDFVANESARCTIALVGDEPFIELFGDNNLKRATFSATKKSGPGLLLVGESGQVGALAPPNLPPFVHAADNQGIGQTLRGGVAQGK